MSPQGFNMSSPWRTGILSFAMFAVQRNQDRWETARQIPHVTKHVIILSRWATSVHCYTQPFRSRAITSSSELYCFTFPWSLFTSSRSLYAAPSNLLQQAWVKSSPSTQKNYPSNYVQAGKKKSTYFLISSSTAFTPSVWGFWNLLVALPKSHRT